MADDPDVLALFARRALGHRLRDARIEADLLLPEAAARAGISWQYLSDCERGNKLPSLVTLLAICSTYNLLLTELLDDVYPFGRRRRPKELPPPPPDARRRS
ncbi:helix-turn-helix domain-containing protein [Oryzihumus leptocrescens]|uniref:DNA-binding XRE family transcriptional regulator n=1 Tax=Oryzihumus leptocrescens TaxID=297536 RepID=A0A542ZIF3_9MICO|nr:helix-turn-helix transcriptional regulator [Oryzihumus leptocrescens]TQL60133.1 DNA-binding XRE family transcriptional regulator [Oryzihumus leptocrescens]